MPHETSTSRSKNNRRRPSGSPIESPAGAAAGRLSVDFLLWCGIWIALNALEVFLKPFNPYPYAFLNFVLGCVAAPQAPVIMMSQNRDSQINRLRADHDYQVNLKADLQIQNLHAKLDELREVQQQQLELLKTWEQVRTWAIAARLHGGAVIKR